MGNTTSWTTPADHSQRRAGRARGADRVCFLQCQGLPEPILMQVFRFAVPRNLFGGARPRILGLPHPVRAHVTPCASTGVHQKAVNRFGLAAWSAAWLYPASPGFTLGRDRKDLDPNRSWEPHTNF